MNKKRIFVVIVVAILIIGIVMVSTFMFLSSNDKTNNKFDNMKEDNLVSDEVIFNETENKDIEDKEEVEEDIKEDEYITTDKDDVVGKDNNNNKDNTDKNDNKTTGNTSSSSNNNGNNNDSNNSTNDNKVDNNGSSNSSVSSDIVVDTSKKVENSNLVLDCDSSYLTKNKNVNCSLVGKVSGYKVSALSAVIDDSNIVIEEFITDSIWIGDGNYGRIDLYTDLDKENKFNIGTFKVSLNNAYNLDKVEILVKDVVFYDENFEEHSLKNLSMELDVK